MYSIVTVIYGIPITPEVSALSVEDPDELEDFGYTIQYHGNSSDTVGYCGVELDSFNECQTALSVDKIKTTPTEEQKLESFRRVHMLSAKHRGSAKIGVYYIFSTS